MGGGGGGEAGTAQPTHQTNSPFARFAVDPSPSVPRALFDMVCVCVCVCVKG